MIEFAVSIIPVPRNEREGTVNYRATARIKGRTLDFVEIRRERSEALEAIFETIRREIP